MNAVDAEIALALLVPFMMAVSKFTLGNHLKLFDLKPLDGGVIIHPARHSAPAFTQTAIIAAASASYVSGAIDRAKHNVIVRALSHRVLKRL